MTFHLHETGREIVDVAPRGEAQRELLFTQIPVQGVGYRLGFSDPAYFLRFFLAHSGLSPRRWRLVQCGGS
jgi:AraC family transcriptional activator of pobA